jgi:hypothetical protein
MLMQVSATLSSCFPEGDFMAVMWPRTLPQWVLQDPRRGAECDVYSRLGQVLDDSWSVYYSRPWWGISRTGGEIDGEADFVVAHPAKGVLFLEVKGGLVSHDPKTSRWTSRDRFGVTHGIKDPVQQAMKSKHELLKKFRTMASWPTERVRLRHGVILPDCEPKAKEPVGSYEQQLFCFSTQLRDRLAEWIADRLDSHADDGRDIEVGPGKTGIAAIDSTIAAPARLVVPLHRELSADISQQDALLTGAQMQAVVSIDSLPRVVAEGGAGTGKTVVACELAARYAEGGRSTLLCCLSEALAASLRRRIGDRPGLVVMTLSEMRVAASDRRLDRFEAVIVDEGQDVDWTDWDMIEACLIDGGLLRVLFDSNQAVYRARDDLETRLQAKGICLQLNLRNTKHIAAVTDPLYRGPLIVCTGPEGRPARLFNMGDAQEAQAQALALVRELVEGHSLAPRDVTLLVPDSKTASAMKAKLLTARMPVTDAASPAQSAVVVETIARFKGLESVAVVILADRLCANNTELSYVAVSRARGLLLVVGPVADTELGRALLAGHAEAVPAGNPAAVRSG